MVHELIALGQHGLDTSSLEVLARDLSDRLGVTVLYGYQDDWLDPERGFEGTYEFIETGRVDKGTAWMYFLRDYYHCDRLYSPGQYEGSVCFELFDYKTPEDFELLIYKESFKCSAPFAARWWSFSRYFNGEGNIAESEMGITWFRNRVKQEVHNLGGKYAFYGDDQGASKYLTDIGEEKTWEEIYAQLQKDFGASFLNISRFMLRKDESKYKREGYCNAFIDDFNDLAE